MASNKVKEAVVIISNEIVIQNREQDFVSILQEQGFVVQQQHKRPLSKVEVDALKPALLRQYHKLDHFAQENGPCVVLLVSREHVYQKLASIQHELELTYYSAHEYRALRDKLLLFPRKYELERTVLVLKPDRVNAHMGHVEKAIECNGFVVIARSLLTLTKAQANTLLSVSEGSSDAKDAMDVMTSGESAVFVLEKMNAVEELWCVAGPEDPLLAKGEAPESLRAMIAADTVHSGMYCSTTVERAARDVAALFPAPFHVTRTVALLLPDVLALGDHAVSYVLEEIRRHGFTIQTKLQTQMSDLVAQQFCAKYELSSEQLQGVTSSQLTQLFSKGHCLVLVLAKAGALESWKALMGSISNTSSLRGWFAASQAHHIVSAVDELFLGFYGSSCVDQMKDDLKFFFPQILSDSVPSKAELQSFLISATPKFNSVHVKSSLHVPKFNDVILDALTHLCRNKPTGLSAIRELADYLSAHNPSQPKVYHPYAEDRVPPSERVFTKHHALGQESNKLKLVVALHSRCVADEIRSLLVNKGSNALGESVDVSICDIIELVEKAKQSKQYGSLIKDSEHNSGRSVTEGASIVPPSVLIELLAECLLAQAKQGVLVLLNFPHSLDHVFELEKICSLEKVIYFDFSESKTLQQYCASTPCALAHDIHEKVQEELSAMMSVAEHFQQFDKLDTVPGECTPAALRPHLRV